MTVSLPDAGYDVETVGKAPEQKIEPAEGEWSWSKDGWADLRLAMVLSLPITFAQIIRLSMGLILSALLGRKSTSLLAGISSAGVWCEPLDEFSRAVGGQTTMLTAQAIGAKNYELAGTYLQMVLVLVTFLSIPTILVKMMTGSVLTFLGAADNIAQPAGEFAIDTSYVVFAELYCHAITGYCVGMGMIWVEVRCCFATLVFGTISVWYYTVVVDAGIFGLAMITSLRRIFHLVTLVCLARWMGAFDKCWRAPRVEELMHKDRWLTLIGQVIPAGLDGALQRIATSLNVALAARLGMVETAAYDMVIQLTLMMIFILWGLDSCFVIVMAQRLGAGEARRAAGITKVGLAFVYSFLIVVSIAVYAFIPYFARLASHDPKVVATLDSIRLFPAINILMSGGLAVCGDILTKQGRPQLVMVTMFPLVWMIGVPISIVFARTWGLPGIFLGPSIAYSASHAILLMYVLKSDWEALAEQAGVRAEVKNI